MPDTTSPRGFPYPQSGDPVAITADIQALAEAVNDLGFIFSERVVYNADDTWTKADYPGLKAVRVQCQSAGSGGQAAVDSGSGIAIGLGGNGGDYASSWLTEAVLGANEAVSVGAAGNGGVAGGASATAGGASSFGAHVVTGASNVPAGEASESTVNGIFIGADNAMSGATGDIYVKGRTAGPAFHTEGGAGGASGGGGDSVLGTGGSPITEASYFFSDGLDGQGKGAGGSGALAQGSSQDGGDGTPGVVIVDIYI